MRPQSFSLVTHKFPSLSGNKTGHILHGSKEQPRTGSAVFSEKQLVKGWKLRGNVLKLFWPLSRGHGIDEKINSEAKGASSFTEQFSY